MLHFTVNLFVMVGSSYDCMTLPPTVVVLRRLQASVALPSQDA